MAEVVVVASVLVVAVAEAEAVVGEVAVGAEAHPVEVEAVAE